MKAPAFTLTDQFGSNHSLEDYRGKWVVLYFYPQDDTPTCTVEACSFRDSHADILALGAAVLGVSADTAASHKKFADKYALEFPLLADTEKTVINAYGAWGRKKLFGQEYDGIIRKTFIIGPDGEIAKEYVVARSKGHGEAVRKDLAALMA